ncbi:MAG: hypothetical protein JW850_06010 [Thermoflexales bacterium]|nr:hypothetical protein [Thermoflexales bacterium]
MPRKRINDIDLSRWRDYEQVWTDSLWLIGPRDRSGGHQLDYHGNFVPQIATQAFTRYTRKGEVVLDLFLGSGTSAIEAVRLQRRCIGVELKPELVDYVRAKLGDQVVPDSGPPDAPVQLLQGDSAAPETVERVRQALAAWGQTHAQLLVLHPPYHDIIRFSEHSEDLSNAPTLDAFLTLFGQVVRNGWELLEPGRYAVLVIGDAYTRGELVPLGFECLRVCRELGFRPKAIIVKDIQGNERGKGRAKKLWRYRALAGGYYIFTHEYVMIFQKPETVQRHKK